MALIMAAIVASVATFAFYFGTFNVFDRYFVDVSNCFFAPLDVLPAFYVFTSNWISLICFVLLLSSNSKLFFTGEVEESLYIEGLGRMREINSRLFYLVKSGNVT